NFLVSVGIPREMAWHFAFGAAAVGMFCGIVQYIWGNRKLGDAGAKPTPPANEGEARKNKNLLIAIVVAILGIPAILGALVLAGVPIGADHIRYGTLILLLALGHGLFIVMFTRGKWTAEERKRLWVILILFYGAIFFFGVFEQAGSTFNLF